MTTVAGIDCGTNSIRLMIARTSQGASAETSAQTSVHRENRENRETTENLEILVPRIMRVVRLGEGVDVHHAFSQAALERVYAAIDEFAAIIAEHQVDVVRFVATSATRDASNRAQFEEYVHDKLGVYPDVISGQEEARLSFLGALSALQSSAMVQSEQPSYPYLVVDLGGGSTELVLGGSTAHTATEVQSAYSMQVGSVRMSERYHLEDAPSEESIEAAAHDIDICLAEASRVVDLSQVRTIVGVSGTVTTMSALALGQSEYRQDAVDGAVLDIDAVDAVNQRVVRMARSERDTLSVVHPGRRDVIGAGALVWSRVLAAVRAAAGERGTRLDTFIASEHGLLDGIVRDLLQRSISA
ncbi:Ppx/GppA phosphatase family protein [Alloscardovia macacae]|uniref:Exopolyphosphatase n=1 Tax=Alloscardovia macacae TaxID=1160091 RepID=A0A261F5E3_9BIFI|nr:exopolyphosphatase [Alloscardovia macacae]OZG54263.1 exopolyphosphatase [Alloscardovia macacae]